MDSGIGRTIRVQTCTGVYSAIVRGETSVSVSEQEFRFKPQRRHSDGLASSGERARSARGRQRNSEFSFVE